LKIKNYDENKQYYTAENEAQSMVLDAEEICKILAKIQITLKNNSHS